MNAEQSCRSLARHRARDRRAPVAALRDITRVPQTLHQLRPGPRDAVGVPTGPGRSAGEAITRQGWDDDLESVRSAAAMRSWICERTDNLQLLDDRAGPAVRDDQRQRIFMF